MENIEEFYGKSYYNKLNKSLEYTVQHLNNINEINQNNKNNKNNRKIIEHIYSRIKSPDSVQHKLTKKKLIISKKTISEELKDIVGIRIVCKFLNDIYTTVDYIKNINEFEIITEKDYIKHPKENGYRSYHLVLQLKLDDEIMFIEIQIRTISQDAWASLEHQMKYKKNILHEKLLVSELKRCADELASTDISMQTIYQLIESDN